MWSQVRHKNMVRNFSSDLRVPANDHGETLPFDQHLELAVEVVLIPESIPVPQPDELFP